MLDLNDVDGEILLQYRLTLLWRDLRLRFRNLKQQHFLNTVLSGDSERMWIPKVVFYNTKEMEESEVTLNKNGDSRQ